MAGNLVNNNGTTRTYNVANQMVNDGTNNLTYDGNGNLTNDGVNAYTWDRANRMLTAPNSTSYVYDGLGNRIQQTVSATTLDYLNDVQPGLVKLLRQDDGSSVEHFVHAPRGIHAMDDGTDWTWFAQDGLGSVRGLVDDVAVVQSSQSYNPYGVPDGAYGAGFGFTGEQTDANGQVYLRARYYNPEMGVFSALDPFEGKTCTPMSLNGYGYVHGNPVNLTDPSGKTPSLSGIANRPNQIAKAVKNLSFVKSVNSGWCNEAVDDGRLYRRNGFDISQDPDLFNDDILQTDAPLCSCYTGLFARYNRNSDWSKCMRGELEPCNQPAQEYCLQECEINYNTQSLNSVYGCRERCLARVARSRMSHANDHTIEFYTWNADYIEALWFDTRHALFFVQPEHSFLIAWHNDEGIAYSGGPGSEIAGGTGDTLCFNAYINVGSESAGHRNGTGAPERGQYDRWINAHLLARTDPIVLLGGQEALDAKNCLDGEVPRMRQEILDENISYCPVTRNSNTIAFSLMERCNIPHTYIGRDISLPGRYNDTFR